MLSSAIGNAVSTTASVSSACATSSEPLSTFDGRPLWETRDRASSFDVDDLRDLSHESRGLLARIHWHLVTTVTAALIKPGETGGPSF